MTKYDKKAKVLVAVVYTDYKQYCRHLYPGIYQKLNFKNKEVLFITEKNCKGLGKQETGEEVAATGRNFAVHYARKRDFTHILFLDIDLDPEKDTIQRLLATGEDIAGALTAARGNSWDIIAHRYSDETLYLREKIQQRECQGVIRIGGVGGCCMLVSRKVFEACDYDEYFGPRTINGRHTADDEWFQIVALQKLGIRPVMVCNLRPWHYNDDGFRYKCFGKAERWDVQRKW